MSTQHVVGYILWAWTHGVATGAAAVGLIWLLWSSRVREPIVYEHVADSGTRYRCTVNGPAHIVVERVDMPESENR